MTGARGRLAGCRVLIVEDEYYLAQDIARALAAAKATVVGPAPTSEDALRLLAEGAALDGAVLDVNLGGSMVYPVADALREHDVPFLFLTGYDRPSLPLRFADIPICEKPSDANTVAASLDAILRRRDG